MSQFMANMIPESENHVRRDGNLRSPRLGAVTLMSCSNHHAKGHQPAFGHGSEFRCPA